MHIIKYVLTFFNRTLKKYKIRVGDYFNDDDLKSEFFSSIEKQTDVKIDKIYRHNFYSNGENKRNDIALIKLNKCVDFK